MKMKPPTPLLILGLNKINAVAMGIAQAKTRGMSFPRNTLWRAGDGRDLLAAFEKKSPALFDRLLRP